MKAIKESENEERWPRKKTESIECRKRDLVVRIANWSRITSGTGGFDVEVYIGGVYDWNESANFDTKEKAAEFAAKQIARLL